MNTNRMSGNRKISGAVSSPCRIRTCRGPCGRTSLVVLTTVLTVLAQTTHAQSYLLGLGKNQLPNYNLTPLFVARSALDLGASQYQHHQHHLHKNSLAEVQQATNDTSSSSSTKDDESRRLDQTSTNFASAQDDESNSTIIVVKNPGREIPSQLSQTAMDVITIVWYVATFLALAAFFLLMACSDRRCADARRAAEANDAPLPPPTPSPSYSEFAPPSYETVMKMHHEGAAKTAIFVIPFGFEEDAKENNSSSSNNNNNNNAVSTSDTPTTPAVNFYTVNELHKQGS